MEHLAVVQQGGVYFLAAQAGIGAGLAGKAERPVAGRIQRDESQGGEHRRVDDQPGGVDADFVQRAFQQVAEGIVAHLAELLQCGQKVARCPAGLGFQGRIARFVGGNRGKINEQFAQCNNIFHEITLPKSWFFCLWIGMSLL